MSLLRAYLSFVHLLSAALKFQGICEVFVMEKHVGRVATVLQHDCGQVFSRNVFEDAGMS